MQYMCKRKKDECLMSWNAPKDQVGLWPDPPHCCDSHINSMKIFVI